jgi:drug/metabolite transporter (DMT)-like permease
MTRRTIALLVLGVVAVSFSAVLVRLADAPGLAQAFYRCAFAAAVVLPLGVVRHAGAYRRLPRARWGLALVSGLFLAGHFATWIPSLSYTSVAASTVIVTTQPLWVALFGGIAAERTSRRALVGIAVALLGTLVITGGDLGGGGRALVGDLLALAGAVCAAVYVLAGRRLRQELSVVVYTSIVYTTAAVALALCMAVSGTRFAGYPAKTWLLLALMTIGPQFLGHSVFTYVLGHVQASVVAIAVMAEPVGATLLAMAILGESPSPGAVIGGVLILGGVYAAIASEGSRRPEVAASAVG